MKESPEALAVRYIYQGSRMSGQMLKECQLTDLFPNHPEVRITRQQMDRFRERYRMLMEFAAAVCKTTSEELTDTDMVNHLFPKDVRREMDRFCSVCAKVGDTRRCPRCLRNMCSEHFNENTGACQSLLCVAL
jgi:hypothetical protein